MQYKLAIYLIVALVLGVFSSLAVKKAMFTEDVKQQVVRKGPTVNVLVAKTDLIAGSEFTAQNIRFDSIPESIIPRDAIFTTDGILHRKAAGDIPKDAVITLFDIKMPQKGEKEDAITFIPPGYSVVPIQIDSVSNTESGGDISDYLKLDEVIKVGDKVELSVVQREESENKRGALPKLVVRTIIPSADVYKVFTELRASDNGAAPHRFSILSVLLDENGIKQVKKAVSTGRIRLSVLKKDKVFPIEQPLQNILIQNSVASQKTLPGSSTDSSGKTPAVSSLPNTNTKTSGNDAFVVQLDMFKKSPSSKEPSVKTSTPQPPKAAVPAPVPQVPAVPIKEIVKTPSENTKSASEVKKPDPIKKETPKSTLILSEQKPLPNPSTSVSEDKEKESKKEVKDSAPAKSVNSQDRSMIDPQLLIVNKKDTALAGNDLPGIAYSQDFTEAKDLKKIPVARPADDTVSKAAIAESSTSLFRYRPGYATANSVKPEISNP
ncbi:MAG: SAF domain-containing protein [Planctomycetia bacterium]|nr:SAF domain-containing protein [Planctomycetia bacterium]